MHSTTIPLSLRFFPHPILWYTKTLSSHPLLILSHILSLSLSSHPLLVLSHILSLLILSIHTIFIPIRNQSGTLLHFMAISKKFTHINIQCVTSEPNPASFSLPLSFILFFLSLFKLFSPLFIRPLKFFSKRSVFMSFENHSSDFCS